ncbi:YbbR-like domain-containing protein [Gelidibacter salicanalis]|uniref:YbbR-like domain-containing protein n=1 Tax=Gelidibacter salicanalis TaxID=291193 RepID=A0A934KVN6_9FLAO|nr:YbbR-like domain-containing protein [Gelidibacter salicanalis]MBJ7881688.1 YbbR-like domain-containing protein [Gelidibacter salicanalis]
MFNKLKLQLSRSIKSRKLNVFGLFFLLSFCFWALTKLSKSYTETIVFEITYKNVPEQHHVDIDSSKKIKVGVKAYGFNLLKYSFFKPTFQIDFKSDVSPKNKTYIWNSKQNLAKINAKFKNSVDVISIQPDTLRFPYQSLAVKKVPVRTNLSIGYATGYDMSSKIKVVPDSVRIIGSKKIIAKIEEVTTKRMELKNINSDIDKSLQIEMTEPLKQLKISTRNVTIKGHVEKFTEGTFNVPVTIINLPADININYFPKTIPVAYNVSLNNYKLVKASDFRIECNFKDIANTEKSFLIPKLVKVPKTVKSARLKQHKVEFILMQ